jgi:SnoaL-like polyketide cyclase
MSIEENKALVQRLLTEVWSKGNLNLIDELIAPDYVLHDPTHPGLRGRAGIRESIIMYRGAFPDLLFMI